MLKLITEAYGSDNAVLTGKEPQPISKPVFTADEEIATPPLAQKEEALDAVIDTHKKLEPTLEPTDDLTIKTALNSSEKKINTSTIQPANVPSHPQNVIKTVDELLEKLNISPKANGSYSEDK